MSKFPSFSDIVTAVGKNHSQLMVDSIISNNALFERFNKAQHWTNIWLTAAHNMPWWDESNKELQQIGALARCLGIPENHVTRAWREGGEPKKPEFRAKLQSFAGSYGTQLAALRLTALGIATRYRHWPTP